MNDMEQDNQITEQNLQPDLYGDAEKKKRKKPQERENAGCCANEKKM